MPFTKRVNLYIFILSDKLKDDFFQPAMIIHSRCFIICLYEDYFRLFLIPAYSNSRSPKNRGT
jgi:hypothetical protein